MNSDTCVSTPKKILIIGAGRNQVPLIEAGKKENYHTIVCDLDPNAPGTALAEEYLRISTKNRQGLLDAAKERKIDGIVANSEYAMCDVAFIASELGLVGNPLQAIETLSSKSQFRELQKKAGLLGPRFISVRPEDRSAFEDFVTSDLSSENFICENSACADSVCADKISSLKEFTYPFIIKPDQNSGTRGTTLVSSSGDDILGPVKVCSELSRNGKVIIEEYEPVSLEGGVEGEVFLHNGEILWDGLFSVIRSEKAPMIPMTYVFPVQETESRMTSLKEALQRMFSSAGVVHGEYNIEAFFLGDVPFLVEINPRQGGNDLPKYVGKHCGIDLSKLLVTTSVGEDEYWDQLKEYPRESRFITHHMLYPKESGRFQSIRISEEIRNWVDRIELYVKAGDTVSKTVDGSSTIGYVDLVFPDAELQRRISRKLEELIRIEWNED